VPAKGWHHVAVTYDGSRWASGVKVYIDGNEARTRVLLDELNQDFRTQELFLVGTTKGRNNDFRGRMRDVRIIRRDITAEEAREIGTPESDTAILRIKPNDRTPGQHARLRRYYLTHEAKQEHRDAVWLVDLYKRRRRELIDSMPTTMVMEEMPKPRPTFILKRGQYDAPGERVSPGTPAILPPMAKDLPTTRLGLARWLVSEDNPLTARVAVNRLWQMLFGTGLVETVDDFGSQGEPPSHPELLDWLAVEFRESGWDVKHILRLIVSSRAYAQSSRMNAAPARLLARMPRLRLPAEMVRDQALAAGGLLTSDIGGPSVKPYQPPGLWKELADIEYRRDRGLGLYRRGVYVFWKRTVPPPGLSAFDAPGREACSVRETRTNTPLQALNLLNDITYAEAARVLAQKAMAKKTDAERVEWMMRRVLARRPREKERAILMEALARHRARYAKDSVAARKVASAGDAPTGGDDVEVAALAAVAGVLLNLDEAIMRE
jgi:hypothetical protein